MKRNDEKLKRKEQGLGWNEKRKERAAWKDRVYVALIHWLFLPGHYGTHARSRVTHEYRSKNREHRDIYTRGSVGDDVHLSRKFLISIVFSDWSSPMISLFLPPPPIHKHNYKNPNPLLDNESVVFFSVSLRSRALFFLFSLFFSTIVFLRPLVSTPLSFSLY